MPMTAKEYTGHGLLWFDYYDEGMRHLPGWQMLAGLDSVASETIKLSQAPLKDKDPVLPSKVFAVSEKGAGVSDWDR
jgi:hypothetical protein